MRTITLEVSDTVYGLLARRARNIGRGTKPEDVAVDDLEQRAREAVDLDRKFIDAGRVVDRRLQLAADTAEAASG